MSWPGSTTAGRMFQYQWKRTDPDSHHDFAAYDGKLNIGRIYREDRNLKSGQWFWTMTAMIPGRNGVVCDGYLPTKEQAATQVESAYTVLKARAAAEAEHNDGHVGPLDD
jgi:hypothetical protein